MIVARPDCRTATLDRCQPPCLWAVIEYYQPNFSGAAIQAHRILARLVERGFTVRVLTMADQAAAHLAGVQTTVDGIHIWYLPVVRRRAWKGSGRGRDMLQSLNESARRFSFDWRVTQIINRHGSPGDILQLYVVNTWTWRAIRAARRRSMHSVIQISLVGSDDPASFRRGRFGISTRMKLAGFRMADRVVGLSSALTRSCEQAGIARQAIEHIPNGVDLSAMAASRVPRRTSCERLRLDPQRKRIVFVGSAIHRKGIDVVIPTFIQLAKRFADVDLLIVGPCDFSDLSRHEPARRRLVDRLLADLEHHGLADRVLWTGEVENVQEFLGVSDVFFFPTRREGLPNALAEAMAAGLPTVASRIDGVTTDLIEDGVEGRLITGEDATDYQQALEKLLNSETLRRRMGAAARRRIERDFDLPRIVTRYEQLYNVFRSTQPPQPVGAARVCGSGLTVANQAVEAPITDETTREEGVPDEQ